MNDVYEWFAGLATIGGFAYFTAGFAFAFAARWLYCRFRHQTLSVPWHYIGITIGCSAIMLTTLQSSSAYNTAKDTSIEVQQCQRQFNAALKGRARVTNENDQLSQDRSTVVFNWIHDLIFPPSPYSSMATDDPERQRWALARTVDTDRQFRALIAKQNDLLDERNRNPLPDPTCGK